MLLVPAVYLLAWRGAVPRRTARWGPLCWVVVLVATAMIISNAVGIVDAALGARSYFIDADALD